MENLTATFIGHKEIKVTSKLEICLYNLVVDLVENKGVTTFLFGGDGDFTKLCLTTVIIVSEKHPEIKRIHIKEHDPLADEDYEKYFIKRADGTLFPEDPSGLYRFFRILRNTEMINKSDFCVFYCRKRSTKKSETKNSFEYAVKKGKNIYNVIELVKNYL